MFFLEIFFFACFSEYIPSSVNQDTFFVEGFFCFFFFDFYWSFSQSFIKLIILFFAAIIVYFFEDYKDTLEFKSLNFLLLNRHKFNLNMHL